MKTASTIKNIDLGNNHPTLFPKSKGSQAEAESPMRLDLKLKILHHSHSSNPSNFRTKKSQSKSKEKQQQSTELLLTERTTGINQFVLTTKDTQSSLSKGSNIKSYLRIKPNKTSSSIPFDMYNNQTIICDRSVYKFDYIFEPETKQDKVYEVVGKQVTHRFIEGYNGTIFAYGSTGSGKTFTMFGNDDGLVPSVVHQIFSKLDSVSRLSCSMIQIYKQNLIDLLTTGPQVQLKIKDMSNNCTIQNLSIHEIQNQEDTLELIKKGNHLKKIRETHLNESSSRSHIVFTFYLQKLDNQGKPIKCKFNLVDLAGSEKVFKSKVQGQGLEEAKKINLSLSCLGNTISALIKNSDHIPYRESKLTRILKQSLMGNSITRLIVTCSLDSQSIEETISSIKFAQRAQKIQTQASIAYNISKFKGEKEQQQRIIRQTLEETQSKLGKIYELVGNQTYECKKCQEIRAIVSKKLEPASQDMFSFKPIVDFKSPKARIDLRGYFSTGSVDKFSSVKREDTRKKSSIKNHMLIQREQNSSDLKEAINKKVFDLKIQNQKLKEDKSKLEGRIKSLEQKLVGQEKQNRSDKANAVRKVIKLGINNQSKTLKMAKDNQIAIKNTNQTAQKKDILKTEGSNKKTTKTDQTETMPIFTKQLIKNQAMHSSLHLINEAISKLQAASIEYKTIIYPLQLEILTNQVIQLQSQVGQNYQLSKGGKEKTSAQFCRILLSFKNKISALFDQLSPIIQKLFDLGSSEYKEELSQIFKDRSKQISDIKWNFKQFCDQNDDLQELNFLLERQKNCSRDKQKIHEANQLQRQDMNAQNQFLSFQPLSLHSFLAQAEGKLN